MAQGSRAQGARAQNGSISFAGQVADGRALYAANCAACHGEGLSGGQFAAALKGPAFLANWGDVPVGDLEAYVRTSMPPGGSGRLSDDAYAALVALIVDENGGELAQPVGRGLASVMPPAPSAEEQNALGIGGISANHPLPAGPVPIDRFANYAPVTPAELANPAPEDWLTWRRGHNGQGFSPLAQINRDNIGQLGIAWAQALPAGANMNEPLVRDGVLYVFGFGDEIFAFDAASGRPLWRYQRQLPEGTSPLSKKTMALWDDMLIASTSDLHIIALDARTGRPVWDVPITDRPGFRNNGGPLVADGVVMNGLATTEPGGGLIAAFDAATGEHLWTFDTVAKTGTPGGDTWNGIPDDERRGGSVWTSGTFDAESGLALWGVAQTYDTGPLRDMQPGMNNDGLFTNSTLAFRPRTGELVWYYQHMPNDQYDLDWVFERVIGTIDVNGTPRRVVMTGGKEGLFDTLDAETGAYIDTADMGFQDFIIAIDPVTGRKTPDPALLPGRDKGNVFMCPHAGGGRNWSPTSFNQQTHQLFVNARDTCMELVPAENGFLSSGVDVFYSAPADSDGNYGFLQAIDMESGEVQWETRRRAPYDMGILGTAGGLLFTGAMDREFIAYDQQTGEQLWRTGLTGVPNASPITYAVDGRQYIAVVTGMGNPLAFGLPNFTPELPVPPVNSSSIYVFALPEGE
ncbi:PQQ-binding-like beta-propeller repeat protein [Alteraurantiacibacter aestuarii]|uniref:outer membrane protein assembly factor BamB family protein n=1 Tax=Alteraurantiacibacter aestuarii TaxID=650004 RepID=UPI0031DDD3E9